jgi:hypothetical protein
MCTEEMRFGVDLVVSLVISRSKMLVVECRLMLIQLQTENN